MVRVLKNEFWTGYTTFERLFFSLLILIQVVAYIIAPDTVIGMICGLSGVICVALTAKGKISSYFFNFIQMATYMVICWQAGLYLEFGEQVFYFLACIYGVFAWAKNMKKNDDGSEQIIARKFKWWYWLVVVAVVAITTLLVGYFGDVVLNSTLSYLDARTVALSAMAQLLMVWRYREQWVMWVAIDTISIIMFALLGQWSMVAMYIAWTINCIYGWYNWSKLDGGATVTNRAKPVTNADCLELRGCPYCGGPPTLGIVGDHKTLCVYFCRQCRRTPVKNGEARYTSWGARKIWNKRCKEYEDRIHT